MSNAESNLPEPDSDIAISGWGIRILKYRSRQGEEIFAPHEVYYSPDGKIMGWNCSSCRVEDETLDGLKDYVAKINSALEKPVHEVEDWTGCEESEGPPWLNEPGKEDE